MIKINLKRILEEKELTQSKLAKRINIRPNTILDLYHGFANGIKFQQLEKICRVLDCSIYDLLEIIPDKEEKKNNMKN